MSSLYARILEARARRYVSGRARSHDVGLPVISVGNLTMGGSGKTPFVEFLARRFRFEGRRPAVLSRGYGRVSRGVVVVSKGEGPLVTAEVGGDEPVEIARRLSGVPVVVARRRVDAARAARELGADLLLLDDGYQHLAVRRDANLLLLDAADPFGGERFPPGGRLREPLSALERADAFVFTRAAAGLPTDASRRTLARWNTRAPIFTARIHAAGLYDSDGAPVAPGSLADRRLIAVCGVARPATFAASLSELELSPEATLAFRDHHRYGARDLQRIRRTAERTGSAWLVTTEKDVVKLAGRIPLPILAVRLAVEIQEEGFFALLHDLLARRGASR